MKRLQESDDNIWNLSGNFQLRTVEWKPIAAKSITLLLHGHNERGLRIFRKLRQNLPLDTYIIAPNGPFPLPRVKTDRIDYGYTWYIYDPFTKSYHIDQTFCLSLLLNMLKQANPNNLPITIIGFSQGGYLAPLVGYAEGNTEHVIGIGCEFRTHFFQTKPNFTLDAIHGLSDTIISYKNAQIEIQTLKEENIHVGWHPISDLKHEINTEVGQTIKKILEQYGERSL